MKCKEQNCGGKVDLAERREIVIGHYHVKELCVCNACGRIYSAKGMPLSEGVSGYFLDQGIVVLKGTIIS
jgi:hypothetical protein